MQLIPALLFSEDCKIIIRASLLSLKNILMRKTHYLGYSLHILADFSWKYFPGGFQSQDSSIDREHAMVCEKLKLIALR